MTDTDTRRSQRIPVYAAIGIDTEDRPGRSGITRNVSERGLLFHSMSRFALGEKLELVYRSPRTRTDTRLHARVVRVASDTGDTSFPHLCAVEFEDSQLDDARL